MVHKRISVSYGLTINLGDFESLRADASVEGDLEPNEDEQVAYHQAWKTVTFQVRDKIRKVQKRTSE